MKLSSLKQNVTKKLLFLFLPLVALFAVLSPSAQAHDYHGRRGYDHGYYGGRGYRHGYYGGYHHGGYWRSYHGRRYWYEGGNYYGYPGGVIISIGL